MRNDEILVTVSAAANNLSLAVTTSSGSAQALNSGNARWVFTALGGDIAIKIGATSGVTGAAFSTGNWSIIVPNGHAIVVRLAGYPEASPPYFCAIGSAAATLHYCMVGN